MVKSETKKGSVGWQLQFKPLTLFICLIGYLLIVNPVGAVAINGSTYTDHLFVENDFIGFIISPYTELLGSDMFILLIAVMTCFMLFMKTQGIAMPIAVGLAIIGIVGSDLPPIYMAGISVMLITGLGFMVYSLFGKR